jgi:hypothetical protein
MTRAFPGSDRMPAESVRDFQHGWRRSVLIVAGAVFAATFISGGILFLIVGTGNPEIRLDVVKTALAIGGGTGALITLMYAVRRQLLAEQIAEDNKIDATEKRTTELYSKGVDQLGSTNLIVRLGGLYALERLGEDSPRLRETVLDVMCAYLRSAEIESDSIMCAAVQDILLDHLAFESRFNYHKTYWPMMMVSLNGAVLNNFHFMAGRVDTAHFAGCTFKGDALFLETCIRGANFVRARFEGLADFSGSKLDTAVFIDAQFCGEANFDRVYFDQRVDFSKATFVSPPSFVGAHVCVTPNSRVTLPSGWRLSDQIKPEHVIADRSPGTWRLIDRVA